MSLRYLLDTSTISGPVAARPDRRLLQKLSQYGARSAIAAPVWHELSYGCERLPPGRRRTELERYLKDVVRPAFPVLPYDQAAAAWHATERARLERAGRPAPFVDGQIAAIARVNGLVLVSANPTDFAQFEDLMLEDWTRRVRRRPGSPAAQS